MPELTRDRKGFMSQAEIAQAHALYIQGMMPLNVSLVLSEQRTVDHPSLPVITAKMIGTHVYHGEWGLERKAYMERQSETIATALEGIKEQTGGEMVVIVKNLHDSFLSELEKITNIRKDAKTARDILDCCKALEVVQKRLFHFHALRSTPLATAAIPVATTDAGHSALQGGEAVEKVS